MGLPDLSNMMKVGQMRYVQAVYEEEGWRNPDKLVRHFLSPRERAECLVHGLLRLRRLRSDPFYFYLLARTLHYDRIFTDMIGNGGSFILNIGCGGDTRAYRLRTRSVERSVTIVECDQPMAIRAKQFMAQRRLGPEGIRYIEVDLNSGNWPEIENWLESQRDKIGLVMLEGVSPYIERRHFDNFLRMISSNLNVGSKLAYDFKIAGFNDWFGGGSQEQELFRLPGDRNGVEEYHRNLGLEVQNFCTSSELPRRLLPRTMPAGAPSFLEDALIEASPLRPLNPGL